MVGDNDMIAATANDAARAGVDRDEAMSVVKCTTRFATVMCIIIACVKVTLYMLYKQEVVRTSALDSVGDLFANCISLYTGYKMSTIDRKRYPAGQGKFQNIGCLVFSTFMFALMFGNLLGNVESLIESKDEVGMEAINRFFYQTGELKGDFTAWNKAITWDDGEDKFAWTDETKMANPVKAFYSRADADEGEKKMAKEMDDQVTKQEIVAVCSEYESEETMRAELGQATRFLGVCATYKLCLWLYCILFAIPKSGSSVLVALATDKRNDFICTYSALFAMNMAFWFRASLPIPEEKVDPLISFILSIVIIATWVQLMVEHMVILSQEAGNDEFVDGVHYEVRTALDNSPCHINDPFEDIKVYHSSEKHTIEVTLSVNQDTTTFGDIAKTTRALEQKLLPLPDVERVVILTK